MQVCIRGGRGQGENGWPCGGREGNGCRCCACARLSILGSTLCVWCCSPARADAPTVQISKFDACSLAIEISNPRCSRRFGSFSTIPGSLLSLSCPHLLCGLGPHGAMLIGWDFLLVRDWAFRGARAADNSHKVCLNGLKTSDSFCGRRNSVVQRALRYRDHVLQY